ncbi:MAG: DNA photolyase family protein [candidate division WOR-3 bacterium]|nr:DNA photolyase family protein [candidate division WOR-3 bacterium]MCX7947163.1 DNA photolyase family protein [candidate division WOR-3 bacterium]MDW8150219.1 deoxyribodipyrimidine photo-lyase [candidate division WOR-3 bacterium]
MRIVSIFSRDFRLLDNKLFLGYEENEIIPLFLFDEYNQKEHGKNLKSLFFKVVRSFDEELKKLNSKLYKIKLEDFEKFIYVSKPDVVRICYDSEPRTNERVRYIEQICKKHNVKIEKVYQFLIEPNFENFYFQSFSQFYKKLFKNYNFENVISKPKYLTTPDIKVEEIELPVIENEKIIRLYFKSENEVLSHFHKFKMEKMKDYEKNRDYPAIDGTSRLSVYFRMGQISYRYVLLNSEDEKFKSEIAWAEFYRLWLYYNQDCVNLEYDKRWRNFPWQIDEEKFNRWKEGNTGYLIVDAGMRQLLEEGYIHNRVRMICASFLIKNLMIDWRLGERWFYENLVDADLSANVGNWQWTGGFGLDKSGYFRIFNPELQREKFDKDFKYIEKYIPDYKSHVKPIVDFIESRENYIKKVREYLRL